MKIQIDDEIVSYDVVGEPEYGDDRVLLEQDDNLAAGRPWEKDGFTVEPFLDPAHFAQLRDGVAKIIGDRLAKAGADVSTRPFTLERYHDFVAGDPTLHANIIKSIQGCFPAEEMPIPAAVVEKRLSVLLGTDVVCRNPTVGQSIFCIRIIRPNSTDFNPPHRDVWIDRLRNAVNIYAPLAGSNRRSSLPLVPGSHHWKESEIARTRAGATVNGAQYTVPAVIGARREMKMVRPDPRENQVLVFSPYLIHGGAVNANPDTTRVSLEMRFWRRP